MSFIENIYTRAQKDLKTIVLPEGDCDRVVKAAVEITNKKIAKVILLGDTHTCPPGVQVVDPLKLSDFDKYIEKYCCIRAHKGVSKEGAVKLFKSNYVFFAAMMVRFGDADGFVAGASYTTRDVARAVIQCVEKEKDISTISSSFVILSEDSLSGTERIMVFADCGIVPEPSADALVEIAISTARLTEKILEVKPRIAMLSYSTKGSGAGKNVNKVVEATEKLKKRCPEYIIEGEIQADVAVDGQVAGIKAPDSNIQGDANILIFPNLESGNISYKLLQRLSGFKAIGPIIQGVSKPCSDLSRGCSVGDVVDTVALVAVSTK